VTGLLNGCVRTHPQLENAMHAYERVLYYMGHIPHEAPADALKRSMQTPSLHY
jgi:hypothetical protein